MGSPDFGSDMMMAGQSPKVIAAILTMRIYEKYFDYMASGGAEINVERMTAALLITCPEKKQRETMWKTFIDQRKELDSEVAASVYAVGDWYEYMSNAMGLNEKSVGGY